MRSTFTLFAATCIIALSGCAADGSGIKTGNDQPMINNFAVAMFGFQEKKSPEYLEKIKNCADGSRSFPDGNPCAEDKAAGKTTGGK
ncbi:hypothetical protein WKW80_09245 [Variovorax humicola]|uniref:Lipoprotein n=1 Tax=Variovorax humicola TaxID=1769758 RepID=A0ABU8VX82_9BURK